MQLSLNYRAILVYCVSMPEKKFQVNTGVLFPSICGVQTKLRVLLQMLNIRVQLGIIVIFIHRSKFVKNMFRLCLTPAATFIASFNVSAAINYGWNPNLQSSMNMSNQPYSDTGFGGFRMPTASAPSPFNSQEHSVETCSNGYNPMLMSSNYNVHRRRSPIPGQPWKPKVASQTQFKSTDSPPDSMISSSSSQSVVNMPIPLP